MLLSFTVILLCNGCQHQLLLLLRIVFPSIDLRSGFAREGFTSLPSGSTSLSFLKQTFLFSPAYNCHRKQPFVARVASSELSVQFHFLQCETRSWGSNSMQGQLWLFSKCQHIQVTHGRQSPLAYPLDSLYWLIQWVSYGDDSQTVLYIHQ